MKLRKLTIQNFRGIRKCSWNLDADLVALIGSGDSTKTTLLDAIGLVLSPRYNVTFTDADFYDANHGEPIIIQAVVIELPDVLVDDRSHGKNRSGIGSNGTLFHDPVDEVGVEECFLIRLTVDSTLEPSWEVVRPGEDEGMKISATQRASLGFSRIGDYLDQNLRWGRNSALSALTASNEDVAQAIVIAQRHARQVIRNSEGTPLHQAAITAQEQVGRLGNGPFKDLRPGLDPSLGIGSGILVLHDGDVPLTQFGLGSKRLLSLSIQEQAVAERALIAIDEVETGLDPHRLHHLIRYLLERTQEGKVQVILTTHSPLVVESLLHNQIFVVRSDDGETSVTCVPPELDAESRNLVQGIMRAQPSALLARRVIVGEGATEVGFIRELLHHWDCAQEDVTNSSVISGVAVADGGGSNSSPKRANAYATLGYPTQLVIDGDVTDNSETIEEACTNGASIVQWPEGLALEDIIFGESSLGCVQELIDVIVEEQSPEAVMSSVGSRLNTNLSCTSVAKWCDSFDETEVRKAIAKTAQAKRMNGEKGNGHPWFKSETQGRRLAVAVLDHEGEAESKLLWEGLNKVREFAYENGRQPVSTNVRRTHEE